MALIPKANLVPKENIGILELKEAAELGPGDLVDVGEDDDEDDVLE
jgi:hypothetical protein